MRAAAPAVQHPERRRPRRQQRRPPGIHGLPGGPGGLLRRRAGGCRGLPLTQEGADRTEPRHRRGGRGRLRSRAGLQRGGAGDDRGGDRGGGLRAR